MSKRSTAAGWSARPARSHAVTDRALTESRRGLQRVSRFAGAISARRRGGARTPRSRASVIGTHLIAEVTGGDFVSLLEPPASGGRRSRPLPPASLFPGAGGPARRPRRAADLADHPLRPPRDRRTERGRALRLDRDRRDPDAAGDDDDRRGEGAGPGHRSAGRPDHRPLRRDVTGGACSTCTACCAIRTVPAPHPR